MQDGSRRLLRLDLLLPMVLCRTGIIPWRWRHNLKSSLHDWVALCRGLGRLPIRHVQHVGKGSQNWWPLGQGNSGCLDKHLLVHRASL